jgi:signal transduction histidine kinase
MEMPGSLSSRPSAGWASRALDLPTRLGPGIASLLVAIGLIASWFVTYFLGGASHVSPHWYYLPVILAAVRFRSVGAVVTALAAAILSGPLMPLDVSLGTVQSPAIWISRACFFMLIGLLVAALFDRARLSLERELELAQEERDLAKRRAAVTTAVSHEFRTPLTVIKGVARTLELQKIAPADARELWSGLLGAVERLEDLVSMVTAAAEDPTQVDLMHRGEVVLGDAVQRVVNRLPGHHALERVQVRPGSHRAVVTTDRLVFERILRELIDNGLKFSPIEASVTVWAEHADGFIAIHVLDAGPGLPHDFLDRAFDPFVRGEFSLTSSAGGLGVGLSAAATLARQLGGRLELRGSEEDGTDAVLAIPMS